MKTKLKTLDEFCGMPPGTFHRQIDENQEKMRQVNQHRRDTLNAKMLNLPPPPELGFEIEPWMFT